MYGKKWLTIHNAYLRASFLSSQMECDYFRKVANTRIKLVIPDGEILNVTMEELCIIHKFGGYTSNENNPDEWIYGPVRLTLEGGNSE